MVSTFVHESVEIAAQVVASRIAEILKAASRRPIGLVVPGGRSPLSVFDKLTRSGIPWGEVTVLPSDERLVPPEDPGRNDLLIRRHLIEPLDRPPRFIPLIRDGEALEGSPEVSEFPWPASVAILGMGSDGHIASLFPGQSDAWRSATRLATGLSPTFPEKRLSLSLDTLKTSLRTFILVFGVDKRDTFQEALSDRDSDLPVAAFLRDTQEPVEVHLTDESPQTLH